MMSERKDVVFPSRELSRRRHALLRMMEEARIDVVLLSNPVSTYYFTGYQTFAVRQFQAYMLSCSGQDAFLAWELELPGVRLKSEVQNLVSYRTGEDGLGAAITLIRAIAPSAKTIGLETDGLYLTAAQFTDLARRASEIGTVKPLGRFVKNLLTVKSPLEINLLRESARITDVAMCAAMAAVHAGAQDNDVAAAGVDAMVRAGGEFTCSFPIVTSGWRSGIPHTTFCRRQIAVDEAVVIELGAAYERYNTALMRTVFTGTPPDGAQALAENCMSCLACVLDVAGPGVKASDVARAAKRHLPLDAPDLVFHHVYGYSVGIGFPPTWADDPTLEITEGNDFVLTPGMVFHSTISPRIFMRYGVAVSETWAVTDDGVEVLTRCERGFDQR